MSSPANTPAPVENNGALIWFPWALVACLAVFSGVFFVAKSRVEKNLAATADETHRLKDRITVLDGERAQLEARNQTLNTQKASLQDRVAALERERKDLNAKLAAREKTLSPSPASSDPSPEKNPSPSGDSPETPTQRTH